MVLGATTESSMDDVVAVIGTGPAIIFAGRRIRGASIRMGLVWLVDTTCAPPKAGIRSR